MNIVQTHARIVDDYANYIGSFLYPCRQPYYAIACIY